MGTPIGTGRIERTAEGLDVIVERTLDCPIDRAWQRLTDPERTAGWVGRWTGRGAPGETIRLQMGFEQDSPWVDVRIDDCADPHRLALAAISEMGTWMLSFELAADADPERTRLRFVHHGAVEAEIGDIGPGWEYYLDALAASIADEPAPDFGDYLPGLREHFAAQLR